MAYQRPARPAGDPSRTDPPPRRRASPAALAAAVGNRAFGSVVGRQRLLARFQDAEHLEVPHEDPLPDEDPVAIELTGSVGRGGDNLAGDVEAVRARLEALGFPAGDSVETLADALVAYQRDALGFQRPDGRADPGGKTVAGLNAGRRRSGDGPGPAPAPPDPQPPAPGKLAAGDHVWYWNGRVSTDQNIPRTQWFPTSRNETDYEGHGREILQFVVYPDHVKQGQPHMNGGPGTYAWIDNNPGNLTGGGTNVGEYPGKRNWHGFLIFPTREAGFDAIPRFLKANHYGPMGIAAAFRRYAPKGDGKNNPETYAQSVARACGGGVTVDTRLDDLTPEQMVEVQKAIAKMEGAIPGKELPRNDPSIPAAVRELL